MDEDEGNRSPTRLPEIIEPLAHRLTTPPDDQSLYKISSIENLLASVTHSYLHFNRVDSYRDVNADPHDAQQLLEDREGNAKARFAKSPDFSMADYYDRSRGRTYACCFSTENSRHLWENYGTGSTRGNACIVFAFGKLRSTLNLTLTPGNAALQSGGMRCKQIFSINYGMVDYVYRSTYRKNERYYPNPIEYAFLKDIKFRDDKELRISLSALGIGRFVAGLQELEFPPHLRMAFDFKAAIIDGTIKEILLAPDSDTHLFHSELHKLGIGTM